MKSAASLRTGKFQVGTCSGLKARRFEKERRDFHFGAIGLYDHIYDKFQHVQYRMFSNQR